jgi:SPP1 family predicted phage head-tail adaptor
MRAGLLRHLLTIQTPAGQTQDANGEATVTWATLAIVWGRITPTSGRVIGLGQIPTANPTATHEIEIRYLKGLTAECRIQYGSRTFTLNSVRNIDERQIRQVMVVTELQ